MDFTTLAEATSPQSIHRFLRSVSRAAAATATSEDDDFSHLDTSHTSHHDYYLEYKNDSILENVIQNSKFDEKMGNTPMFSPAAEAELFMLATNFLLCE